MDDGLEGKEDRLRIPEITTGTTNCQWRKKSELEEKIDTCNSNKWGHQHTKPSLIHVFRLNSNSIIAIKTGYQLYSMLENAV